MLIKKDEWHRQRERCEATTESKSEQRFRFSWHLAILAHLPPGTQAYRTNTHTQTHAHTHAHTQRQVCDNDIIVPEHTAMQIGKMACVAIRRSLPSISIILMHCYWWPALTQLTVSQWGKGGGAEAEGAREPERGREFVVFEKSFFFSALIFLPWSPAPLNPSFFSYQLQHMVTFPSSFSVWLLSLYFIHPPELVELQEKLKHAHIWAVFSLSVLPYFLCWCVYVCVPVRVSVCMRSWENGLLILVCSLAPRLVVLARVWSRRLDQGAFVAADGTELSQVAHTEHAPWRADGRKVKALWFLIVSRRLLGCVRYPQSTSSVQELYSSISGHRFLGPETHLPKISSLYQTTTGL